MEIRALGQLGLIRHTLGYPSSQNGAYDHADEGSESHHQNSERDELAFGEVVMRHQHLLGNVDASKVGRILDVVKS
jgi:hypothetical protein